MRLSAAFALVLLFGMSSVSGQFEDVKECVMNEQFVPMIVDCFVVKFYAMFNVTPSAETDLTSSLFGGGESHVGRKLQSVDNSAMQSHYISHVMERKSSQGEASKAQQSVLDRTKEMFLEVTKDASKDDHSGNKEFDELLDLLLNGGRISPDLLDLLQPVVAALGDLRRDLKRIQDVLDLNEVFELFRIKSCLDSLGEEAFEDGLTWLRCLYVCSDLPLASTCLIDSLNTIPACSRVPWVADLILRFFVDYMKLQQCYFDVITPTVNGSIELIEGRGEGVGDVPTQFIEFRSYLPPGVHCFPTDAIVNRRDTIGDIIGLVFNTTAPCVVQIQLTTSNYLYDVLPYIRRSIGSADISLGRPRCRNETAINQIVIGWHEHAVNASGIIVLERSNWNETFRIPVVARVDHKVEDDDFTEVNFTIKMIVDAKIQNTTKVLTRVYNRDVEPSICQSINDPHIVTFDDRYYNNLYQGYFVFYKHRSLPYEVQLIYQSCGTSTPNGESCNCGAAVRSGDDVFVVDRCRLKPEVCSGEDCRLMKVTLFVNGDLTPGTRIFQLDGGLSYEVILPHGTIVKIKSNGEELINVWVIPSPYDRDNTLGLCGTFNVNPDDDFAPPDGANFTITNERDFIQAWRVAPEDRIFDGWLASGEPFQTTNYCRCSHYVLSGIECHCGYGELVETCDLALENEFTSENLTSILKHSKRTADPNFNETYNDPRDINETLVPQDPVFSPPSEQTQASAHCKSFLLCSEDPLLEICRVRPNCDGLISTFPSAIRNAYEGCLDDYKIIHNNNTIEWKMAATDAAKVGCLNSFERSPKFLQTDMQKVENNTCINECYYRGTCLLGRCECNEGYTGADCSLLSSLSKSTVLLTEKTGLCDKRHEDCSFATIYGKYFTVDSTLTCTATQIKVLDTETVSSSVTPVEVGVLFINLNQVACRLPYAASYKITLKQDGVSVNPPVVTREYSSEITVMAYDSVCYTCNMATVQCTRKEDKSHCLVGGVCYANNQTDASDSCKYCNSSYSTDQLYDSQDPYCVKKRQDEADQRAADKKNQDIRIAVGCSLSALIIIISVVVFFFTKKKEKELLSMEKKSISDTSSGDKITYTNSEFALEQVTSVPPNGVSKLSTELAANNNTISPYDSTTILEGHDYADAFSETDPPTTASPTPTSTINHAPKNRDLIRVKADVGVTPIDRNRSTSFVSSSSIRVKDTHARKDSDAGSVKSHGIGGGGPFGYGRTGHHSDQTGIGAHGMHTTSTAGHTTVLSERL